MKRDPPLVHPVAADRATPWLPLLALVALLGFAAASLIA